MRIVFDDAPTAITPSGQFVVLDKYVINITDEEWDDIYDGYEDWVDGEWQKVYKQVGKKGYNNWAYSHRFRNYLCELIKLKRAMKCN